MDMDVFNISVDDNASDTSSDDLEDEDYPFCKEGEGKVKGHVDMPSLPQFLDWERPKLDPNLFFFSSSALQEQPDPFQFFLLDSSSTVSKTGHPGVKGCDSGVGKLWNVIRLFGVTTVPKVPSSSQTDDEGFVADDLDFEVGLAEREMEESFSLSVCANLHGFLPYFYVLPGITTFDDFDEGQYWKETEGEFQAYLEGELRARVLKDLRLVEYHKFLEEGGSCVERVEVLVGSQEIGGIYHFFESTLRPSEDTVVLKVYCSLSRFIWTANAFLEGKCWKTWKFECFEGNINNVVRFMSDRNFAGCSWFEVKGSKYFTRNETEEPKKESYCQIEIDLHVDDIFPLPSSHSRYKVDPALRVLSFDIEVMVSLDDGMPLDGRRQVIQIASVLGNYYKGADDKSSIIGKTVFVLGTCNDIPDARVLQFFIKEKRDCTDESYLQEAEAVLLKSWRDFILQMDPDIIIGYNIKKFDFPYLLDRAVTLSNKGPTCEQAASLFPFLGRLKGVKGYSRRFINDLKKMNDYDDLIVSIQGRPLLDLYTLLVRHDRVRGGRGYLTLSKVGKRYLATGEEKHDVHYSEIPGLQHGNAETRNRLARYCIQDALIPYLLLFKPVPCRSESVCWIDFYFMKSRLGGPLFRYLCNKSRAYNDYYKQVRVQKNPGKAVYVPETPSPRKPLKPQNSSQTPNKTERVDEEGDGISLSQPSIASISPEKRLRAEVRRALFTDSQDYFD